MQALTALAIVSTIGLYIASFVFGSMPMAALSFACYGSLYAALLLHVQATYYIID